MYHKQNCVISVLLITSKFSCIITSYHFSLRVPSEVHITKTGLNAIGLVSHTTSNIVITATRDVWEIFGAHNQPTLCKCTDLLSELHDDTRISSLYSKSMNTVHLLIIASACTYSSPVSVLSLCVSTSLQNMIKLRQTSSSVLNISDIRVIYLVIYILSAFINSELHAIIYP